MLKTAGDPKDEGISDVANNSHLIINPSRALREQVLSHLIANYFYHIFPI